MVELKMMKAKRAKLARYGKARLSEQLVSDGVVVYNPDAVKLTFADLFCGIGGFRIAFQRAGARCVFSCDWDKHAQVTYEANFGERPHGNIHEVAVAAIPHFDILCAGFPCQPFSIAGVSKKVSLGLKHGFQDEKQGNLFFDIANKPCPRVPGTYAGALR